MARKVLVRSRFLVPLIGQCRRCLTSVRLDAPVELTRTYVPEEQARPPAEHRRAESEGSLDPGLADEDRYAGKEIDLTPAVREQILLYIPPPPPRREACLGPSPTRRKDLDEAAPG